MHKFKLNRRKKINQSSLFQTPFNMGLALLYMESSIFYFEERENPEKTSEDMGRNKEGHPISAFTRGIGNRVLW